MACCTAGTLTGAAIGGPVGAMVGCAAGSVAGYIMSDDYQSLINSLEALSDDERAELVKRVQELVKATTTEALTTYVNDEAQRSALLHLLNATASELTAKSS